MIDPEDDDTHADDRMIEIEFTILLFILLAVAVDTLFHLFAS